MADWEGVVADWEGVAEVEEADSAEAAVVEVEGAVAAEVPEVPEAAAERGVLAAMEGRVDPEDLELEKGQGRAAEGLEKGAREAVEVLGESLPRP